MSITVNWLFNLIIETINFLTDINICFEKNIELLITNCFAAP